MTPILLALLTALPLPLQESELLPPAPAGWRFERIDFPLDFAAGLDYEGFEELWFAPGMFTAGADSYFSYVLGVRIEEDTAVTEAFVQSFLEVYYRGLCEGREPALDLSGFKVVVEREDPGYVAVIDMVDPFVTHEALRLRLEIEVHAGARHTELFGAVSPLPVEAAIWKELRGMRAAWSAARSVPAFLNHVYVVPDAGTYAALRDSEFLRGAFAISEQRTTERRDTSYTGVYFYGERTHFEFLEPDEASGFSAGQTGVGFGFEQVGGTKRVATVLKAREITTFAGPITRGLGGEQLPWFEIMGVEQPTTTSTLNLFSLEYDPRFLERWHPELEPAAGGISRRAVLARYAASLDRGVDTALFRDVTAIHLQLDEAELARTLGVCRAFGYVVEQRAGEWLCDGPQVDLILRPADAPGGITAFELSLRKPVEREPMSFGRARLTFDGARALFTFAE